MDERPRPDTEDNWLLTIIRIPLQQQGRIPYITIPVSYTHLDVYKRQQQYPSGTIYLQRKRILQ